MFFSKAKKSGGNDLFPVDNPKKKLRIISLECRDGQQSLLGTRVRTEDLLPIAPLMDEVGYECIEMWGGATFDVAIRYLEDDPWERLREFKKQCPKTPLRMLLRGQNLVGYRHYPDDIVKKFVQCAAKNGIDHFAIMDGLNDVRNTESAAKAILKCGKRLIASIPFTLSPVHTVEKYTEIVCAYEALGVQAIELEDMAGMISPQAAVERMWAFKKALRIPVYYHAHCTGGMADVCYWEAIKAGAEAVCCNVSSMALGAAHPPVESFVIALRDTPYDTGLNLDLLGKINNHFQKIREKYKEYESKFVGVDVGVLKHKIPGGMLSNLELQLKQMQATDRQDELFGEVARVSQDFGYPPLATPFAQMVGAQAVLNVISGERYKLISKECKNYILGQYGRSVGPIAEELQKSVLGENPEMITVRPGSLLAPGWENAKAESAGFAQSDEDVLTYALFPEAGMNFLKKKYLL
jgi:pyruvate carboxylase subunit B